MSLVFKVGDVVYHPQYGECKVTGCEEAKPATAYCFAKKERVYVDVVSKNIKYSANIDMFSFTPWPAPNHERPLEEGLYKIQYLDFHEESIAVYKNKTWWWCDGGGRQWYSQRVGQINNTENISVLQFLCPLPNN